MEVLARKLKLSKVPEKLWTHLMVDFITKLLLVAGKDTILVVCNRLSKKMHYMTTTEETSVQSLVWLLKNNVWKFHRLLENVVLYREPQFAAELTKKLTRILVIKTKLSISFHSQTDGQTE